MAIAPSPLPRDQALHLAPEERALHASLDRMFEEAKQAREAVQSEWDENLAYARGHQWRIPRPQGFAQVTNNIVWRILQQSAALMTDVRPNVEVTSRPNAPGWERLNREIRKTTEAIWSASQFDRQVVRICYDLYLTSKAYAKVYWDPLLLWGAGDISLRRLNPRHLYLDPNADALDDADFYCYRVPVSLWELMRRYPADRAALVRPDASLSAFTVGEARHRWFLPRPRRKRRTQDSAVPKAWAEEWMIRDPALDRHGRPLYPAGRLVIRAGTPPVVLYDKAYSYWDPWPGAVVDFTVNQFEEGPYGDPDVTQLRQLQDACNTLTGLVIDNTRLMTNGLWIMDEDALADDERDKLTARPGMVVVKRGGKELRRDTGQPLPNSTLEVLQILKQEMQYISGLQDTGYGKPPKGVTAAAAIDALQMATQAMIRLKSRELEYGMMRVGQHMVAREFQFYTSERVIDLLGPQGFEPFRWDPRNFALARTGPGASEADLAAAMGGDPLLDDERRELLKQFRVRITPGSSLAMSKERRWAMEMALHGAGLIDQQAVLSAIDYPDKDAVLARMQQQAMMAATMRAQGGGAPGHPGRPRSRGVSVTQHVTGR